ETLRDMFCRDWHSIHQPHLILTKGLVLISGPPQGRYEQCDDRHFDREDSEIFQGGFSRSRHRSHTRSSGGGLVELLYFSLIFGDAGPRRKRSSAQVGDVRYWPKADICSCTAHVRFRGSSGHELLRESAFAVANGGKADIRVRRTCPLMTQSGHHRLR